MRVGRRIFLGAGFAAAVATVQAVRFGRAGAAVATAADGAGYAALRPASGTTAPLVTIEKFSADGKSAGTERVAKVIKSDAEWRAQLSPLSYQVTRHEGTEYAFSGEYAHSTGDGIYHCICCDTPLYDSKTKYDSGTGWPSFWQPISSMNIVKSSDSSLGMQRDAISCRLCDAHLGHVFDDGPRPTGLRYCMNSVSLRFVKRA